MYNNEVIDEKLVKKAGLDDYVIHLAVQDEKKSIVNETEADDEILLQKLKKKHETKEEMAKRLGISRSTLYRRMKEIQKDD